ncbi:acetate kinase-like protein [Hapsidospora chrysogenum ATCC 11550]|uniref:Probable acetate kinase n=1 Tax=Hapsidospora chrysogenum (strain ATCC 11550 / CBS 779.69 / DSM 880 / IAM 14645 / JCM 23072 / IMI 49137) TaxID=857340 RepID=A0A086T8T6_HAPC1|nr:acetate kinase-like protein [Hapsidospora chrysogenum ATCC 11550]
MKVILAINAGSSSVKVSVYTSAEYNATPKQIAEAQVSGLTAPPTKLTYTRRGQSVHKNKEVGDGDTRTQDGAFRLLLETLVNDAELTEISSTDDIGIVAHRIVHGGDYDDSQLITADTHHHLEALSDLAPLHNSAALGIVDACIGRLPRAHNVACFDSQFHHTIPPHISTYPIDQNIARSNGLRKYGFHGISYEFIARSVARFLRKDRSQLDIIALHLGSGASACAIRNGKSLDTSMGLTPLAGLPGATRSGSVDPSLVFHYASDVGKLSPASTEHLHISKAEDILNRQAGWSALTGTTDFGTISARDTPERRLAFDLFADRVAAYVGSYFVALSGRVDALVFAGGIGEKATALRADVVGRLACLGFAVDEEANNSRMEENKDDDVVDVSAQSADGGGGSDRKVLVCRTDEQFEMARVCTAKQELWAS